MAERTTTQKAPEEGPQQAGTTKREVVDITGNVVRAPELRYTSGGTAICNVRLAVDGDDGQTHWYTVTVWEHLAEAVGAHVNKGDRLGVRDPLGDRQWTGRDGAGRTETVVTVWVVHLHRRKPTGATGVGG
jgi:single stranded DNA-binding protein